MDVVTENESIFADLLIDGEKIAAIGPKLPIPSDTEVIDVSGN